MQISRSIPVACAAVLSLAPFLLNAQTPAGKPGNSVFAAAPATDPALIEKAREALHQRMSELQTGQPNSQSSAPAPMTVPKVEPRPVQPAAVEPYTLTPSDAATAKNAKEIIADEERTRVAAEKEMHRLAAEDEKARTAAEKENQNL